MRDITTSFVGRLRSRDPDAWFELWETFGPVLRAQFSRWGRGRIGVETVQDLSQETLAALAGAIDRHDPSKGARFSTWLFAIAKYTLGDEIDKRMAKKRGEGVRPVEFDEAWGGSSDVLSPDQSYERDVFEAKIQAALRAVERTTEFFDFEIYRRRVFDGRSGREVSEDLGTSEATVSRRLSQVRAQLRKELEDVIGRFSFTDDEYEEAKRNGLDLSPTKADEALFDEALAEIYHRLAMRGEGATPGR